MARTVKEWIGATDDTSIPPRVHLRVRDKADMHCAICTRQEKRGQADHVKAIINGGPNRESNLQWLCVPCHKEKTADDVAEKSRVYEIRLKDAGLAKAKSARPLSRFKRRMDGKVVYRETGELVRPR